MAQNIEMEKWANGGGVTFRFGFEYSSSLQIVSLTAAELDKLAALIAGLPGASQPVQDSWQQAYQQCPTPTRQM